MAFMDTIFVCKEYELSLEQGSAHFFYELKTPKQTYTFTETLLFPSNYKLPPEKIILPFLDTLLLMLGISYWKTFCPKRIELPTISLTKEQAQFWDTVYTKGLGELFYKNKIDYRDLVHFPSTTNDMENNASRSVKTTNHSLLLFGGGKDSIVSAELLKKSGKPFTLLQINTSAVQEETTRLMNAERIIITRILDPQLFALNKKPTTYNGHVPVTAIWECIGLFCAALYGYSSVIASNEQSANYGNVTYLGEEINHQWSKSLEFEILLQEYTKKYITRDIVPFSLLRSLNELQIMKQFVEYPQYFSSFSSCNQNFRIKNPSTDGLGIKDNEKRWCGKCAKCLFVFILLSAFLPKKQVITIFGNNLFSDASLVTIWEQLLGLAETKPFECVGTPQEVIGTVYLVYKKGEYNTDRLMRFFIDTILPSIDNPEKTIKILLDTKGEDRIPNAFKNVV